MTQPPGGRGGGPPSRNGRNQRIMIIVVVLALLGINLWISSRALQPNPRINIPYSPTFLTQVKDGNVKAVSSTSYAVQGTFKKQTRYPAGDKSAQKTLYFSTQIPAFAGGQKLASLLEGKGVEINAENPNTGGSFLEELILGIGPWLIIMLVFFFFIRRAAAGGGAGGLMSFGRSRAARRGPGSAGDLRGCRRHR